MDELGSTAESVPEGAEIVQEMRPLFTHFGDPPASRAIGHYNPSMLRLLGFIALTLGVFYLLTWIPFIGDLAGAVPILGIFLAAAIVSRLLAKWGSVALDRRKEKALMRELGAVDTPHNQGKLGLLMLKQNQYKRAIPLLEEVVRVEPDSADWNYRLGSAYLGAKQDEQAVATLARSVELEEEHAYGAAMMRLAEAKLMLGDAEGSLEALERVDLNHGPGPECAYRKGARLQSARSQGRRL